MNNTKYTTLIDRLLRSNYPVIDGLIKISTSYSGQYVCYQVTDVYERMDMVNSIMTGMWERFGVKTMDTYPILKDYINEYMNRKWLKS